MLDDLAYKGGIVTRMISAENPTGERERERRQSLQICRKTLFGGNIRMVKAGR